MQRSKTGSDASPQDQLLALVRQRDIAIVALAIVAQYAAGGLFDATFGVHLHDAFGLGAGAASRIFALEPLAYLLTLSGLAPFVGRMHKPYCATLGLGLTALSLPLLTLGRRRASVTVATVVHGVGYGFKDAACHALLAQLVERTSVGSFAMAFSLADVADSVGYVLGPPLGSALCTLLGRTGGLAVFAAGIGLLLPAMASVAAT